MQSLIQILSHTVNEKHKEGEGEREAVRNSPPPPCTQFPLLCPIRFVRLQGLGGGEGSDWLAGKWRRSERSRQTVERKHEGGK